MPSLLVIKFVRSLVCHQLHPVFPSRESSGLVRIVELLPDDDADTGGEHEE